MAAYRAIILFNATDDAAAAKAALAAAKAANGKMDRLTTRTESWGAVEVAKE